MTDSLDRWHVCSTKYLWHSHPPETPNRVDDDGYMPCSKKEGEVQCLLCGAIAPKEVHDMILLLHAEVHLDYDGRFNSLRAMAMAIEKTMPRTNKDLLAKTVMDRLLK